MNIYRNNTPSPFRTALSVDVLGGSWEVALSKVVYPSSLNNVEGNSTHNGPIKMCGQRVVKFPHVGTGQHPILFCKFKQRLNSNCVEYGPDNISSTSLKLHRKLFASIFEDETTVLKEMFYCPLWL